MFSVVYFRNGFVTPWHTLEIPEIATQECLYCHFITQNHMLPFSLCICSFFNVYTSHCLWISSYWSNLLSFLPPRVDAQPSDATGDPDDRNDAGCEQHSFQLDWGLGKNAAGHWTHLAGSWAGWTILPSLFTVICMTERQRQGCGEESYHISALEFMHFYKKQTYLSSPISDVRARWVCFVFLCIWNLSVPSAYMLICKLIYPSTRLLTGIILMP